MAISAIFRRVRRNEPHACPSRHRRIGRSARRGRERRQRGFVRVYVPELVGAVGMKPSAKDTAALVISIGKPKGESMESHCATVAIFHRANCLSAVQRESGVLVVS